MNRALCRSQHDLTPDALPPPRTRPRAPGEPVRALFLHAAEFGFSTLSQEVEAASAQRDDVDAVHVRLVTPLWLRRAIFPSPFRTFRAGLAWRVELGRLLRARLPLERFDVVHATAQQRALALAASRRRSPAGPRLVVNIDATSAGWCDTFGFPRPRPNLDMLVERRVFDAADAVACWSEWAAGSLARDYGVAREKTFLHRPCVTTIDPDRALAARAAARDRASAAGAVPLFRIAFVGNNWDRKGGPRLLRWHQERWRDRAVLDVCSAEAPIDPDAVNVVWRGAVSHETVMREVLPAADAFVMPTRRDSFLIAALEAQACGVPVVSSRLAAIPEVVADGESGFLCDPRDDAAFVAAVERLMDDPGLLHRTSLAAIRHVQTRMRPAVWHHHLLDQLVRVADGLAPVRLPAAG